MVSSPNTISQSNRLVLYFPIAFSMVYHSYVVQVVSQLILVFSHAICFFIPSECGLYKWQIMDGFSLLSGFLDHTPVQWLIEVFCLILWTSLELDLSSLSILYVYVCMRKAETKRESKHTRNSRRRNTSDSGVFLIYCILWPSSPRPSVLSVSQEHLKFASQGLSFYFSSYIDSCTERIVTSFLT